MTQNCVDPDAAKCVLTFDDIANLPSLCGPVLGSAVAGEMCDRPNDISGEDTCAPGFFCNRIDTPASQPGGTCRTLCDDNAQCASDEWCYRLNKDSEGPFAANTRLIGHCAIRCDSVWDLSCQAETKCLGGDDVSGVRRYSCFPSLGKAAGESCAGNNDCEPSLGCDAVEQVCAPFCDPTHPCGLGQGCSSTSGLGFCRGAPADWACDADAFADGTTCDCGCATTADPDCLAATNPVVGCVVGEVCALGQCVPEAWTCSAQYYGSDDGCDCGCGVVDPDCVDATVASCEFCQDLGGCNATTCPGNIDPLNNAICQ